MERRGKEQLKVAMLLCSSKEVDFEVFIHPCHTAAILDMTYVF